MVPMPFLYMSRIFNTLPFYSLVCHPWIALNITGNLFGFVCICQFPCRKHIPIRLSYQLPRLSMYWHLFSRAATIEARGAVFLRLLCTCSSRAPPGSWCVKRGRCMNLFNSRSEHLAVALSNSGMIAVLIRQLVCYNLIRQDHHMCILSIILCSHHHSMTSGTEAMVHTWRSIS